MKKTIIILVCILAVCGVSCRRETPQDKLKKIIATIQQAVEEKDVKKVLGCVSKNYTDPRGNTFETIKGILLAYFYQYPKISIYIPSLDVTTVADDSATAVFQAVLTGRNGGGAPVTVLPESLGLYTFELSFRKESGEWIIYSAVWERVGDAPEGSARP